MLSQDWLENGSPIQEESDDVCSENSLEMSEEKPDKSPASKETKPSNIRAVHPMTPVTSIDSDSTLVNQCELVAFMILVYAAAVLAMLTGILTNQAEERNFQSAFASFGSQALSVAENNLQQYASHLHFMATSITSLSQVENGTWPFITIPDFEARAVDEFNLLSEKSLLVFSPLVDPTQVEAWNDYSEVKDSKWMQQRLAREDPNGQPIKVQNQLNQTKGYAIPVWQYSPLRIDNESLINVDLSLQPTISKTAQNVIQFGKVQLSDVMDSFSLVQESESTPTSVLIYPVFDTLQDAGPKVVGFLSYCLPWEDIFSNLLPGAIWTGQLVAEISSSCGLSYTFSLNASTTSYLGSGHYKTSNIYQDLAVTREDFASLGVTQDMLAAKNLTACLLSAIVYPTEGFESAYKTNLTVVFTASILSVFLFTAFVFLLYGCLVRKRNKIVTDKADRTTAIVASLFPENVQRRILEEVDQHGEDNSSPTFTLMSPKFELKQLLGGTEEKKSHLKGKPIADLFPNTTVMFADIVGFTAWSSMRAPTQVFTLLESIYQQFDLIAKRRRVFKVETVGDCYVAVCGLPDPRKDHATVMARFATECLSTFFDMTRYLEVELGPDTADLGLRIGLHSGPVTAGVLRGERARFQLFGDTVNTTARMESTGERNLIQISAETAGLLEASGKAHWIRPRDELVHAKGKGDLQTFWLQIRSDLGLYKLPSSEGESSNNLDATIQETTHHDANETDLGYIPISEKHARLVKWNVELLAFKLKELIAHREATGAIGSVLANSELRVIEASTNELAGIALDEVEEIIRLPEFTAKKVKGALSLVTLNQETIEELQDYVKTLSCLYRKNAFHNFEHASHVTMSVNKLFSRIVAPDISHQGHANSTLYDHTYGISADPLTQFSVHLAALMHDVDHTGVPNAQLMQERTSLAAVYRGKSVAEQNSIDLSWDLLMDPRYSNLRGCIYTNSEEFTRFRQLVVNAVMATDVMDRDLNSLRSSRWNKAFTEYEHLQEDAATSRNRKATIVIEHLIQASDVAHTMQHWHVYRKWNERLFTENYQAYLDGRADQDPSLNWYEGELGFFDYYVIPMAKKLKDCGVFGVSSDEYLNYAEQNRAEWERKGRDVVSEYVVLARNNLVASRPLKRNSLG